MLSLFSCFFLQLCISCFKPSREFNCISPINNERNLFDELPTVPMVDHKETKEFTVNVKKLNLDTIKREKKYEKSHSSGSDGASSGQESEEISEAEVSILISVRSF